MSIEFAAVVGIEHKSLVAFALGFGLACSSMAKDSESQKSYKRLSPEELKQKLSPLQYEVTMKEGTERAFANEFWNHKEPGIYVDVTTGEPLFSSLDKYDSGSGWPSFTKPILNKKLVEKTDKKLLQARTEVRSSVGDAHLGHVFPDGPGPSGLRYCINSAALRFVHKRDLVEQGYSEFLDLFE